MYVFIDRIEQVKEFASVAMRFPKIGGRIKLDSRKVCDPEREKIPMQLDSEEQQKSLAEKIRKLGVWKESVREIVVLVGSEMGLDEDGFKVRFLLIFFIEFFSYLETFTNHSAGEIGFHQTAASQSK